MFLSKKEIKRYTKQKEKKHEVLQRKEKKQRLRRAEVSHKILISVTSVTHEKRKKNRIIKKKKNSHFNEENHSFRRASDIFVL